MHQLRFPLVLIAGALCGCTTSQVLVPHAVDLASAEAPIPEGQLLDVGIRVFNPGVPEGEVDKEVLEALYEDGVYVHIRRAESIYMATQLRATLQRAGYWGTVWTTPDASVAADLDVTTRIEQSDGHIVRVHVTARDATGREWLNRPYEHEFPSAVYGNRQRHPDLDPYQDLFNSIANDLAAVHRQLSADEARRIREVSALRYAAELSPDAFGEYVVADRDGTYRVDRLPALDDPMFDRTQRVRQRERIFLETLNQRYEGFSVNAAPSYDSWREYAREEAVAIRELTRGARWRKALGAVAMAASVASLGSGGGIDSFASRAVRDSLMMMGAGLLEASAVRLEERRLHGATLEELSTSFDDEVKPMVVEIGGVQRRLVGTAELQFAEWRELLKRLLAGERGFEPENVEIYPEEAVATVVP